EQLTLNERWALNTKSDGTKAIYGRTAKTSATGQTRRSLFGHCGVPDDVHPHSVHDSGTWPAVCHLQTVEGGRKQPKENPSEPQSRSNLYALLRLEKKKRTI